MAMGVSDDDDAGRTVLPDDDACGYRIMCTVPGYGIYPGKMLKCSLRATRALALDS